MKRSIIFFFLLVLPFISNGQGTQYTGAPTQVNAIRGGAKADSAQWLPIGFAIYPWFDSTGRIWYSSIDSSLYYHTGHKRVKLGSGGGGGSTDTTSLSHRIDLKINKSDSNLLSGYFSYFAWLRDSSLIMNNFSNYSTLTQLTNALAPYATIASTWSRTQIDSILTAKSYETIAHAAATYYPLTNPANYITNIPVADTANSIRVWANGQFYLASNPNNYTDNTPLIDTAAAHLALINSKVSLAKHTTDSIQYYLSLGDTASAIRAFIMGLPNYGISPTDISHWNTAYNKYIVSHSFNPATGVLTITLNDATTVTANLDGRYLKSADWVSDSTAMWAAINTKQAISDTLTYDATKKNLYDTAIRLQTAINTKVDASKYGIDSSRVIRQGGDNRNTPDSIGTKDLTGTVFLANGVGVVFINSPGLVSIGAVSDGASGMYVSGHKIRANLSSPNQNTYEGGYNGNIYYLMLGDGSATFGSAPPTANAYQVGVTPFSNTKIGVVIQQYDSTTSTADLTQWQSKTGRVLSRVTHTGGVVWNDTVVVNGRQYLNNTPAYSTGGDSMLVKNSTTKRVETIPVIAYVDSVKRIGDTVWYYKAGVKTFAFTDSLASGGGSGTVTSIATSKGILGGTITGSGTLYVDTTGTSGTAVASQAWVNNKSYLTSYTETDPVYTANGLKKSDTASLVVTYANQNTAEALNVKLAGSYANPTWLTSLAWSKITVTPTTLLGYGITNAVANTVTVNGKALSTNITLGLASSDFANQGTANTVLHGNASGNPSFGAVSLTADVSGLLPSANIAVTLTGKRITSRIGATASSATPTPDGDNNDVYEVTALAVDATFAAPSGTPTDGQPLLIRIKDNGTSRTLAWNAIYRAGTDFALPTSTTISKTVYIQFVYNSADSKWDAVGLTSGL